MSRHRPLRTSLIMAAAAGAIVLAIRPAAAEAPEVVVSIKPVHSLVAAVMAGIGTPRVIVEGAGSPHAHSLRPSDARALDRADVVFWVGPGLETFLQRPLEALASDAEIVALGETPGLTLLPTRAGGVWERHAHHGAEHAHEHDDDEHAHDHHGKEHGHGHHGAEHAHGHHDEEHTHAHGDIDMHVWLDPRNAQVMVERIALTLEELDPEHAATYAENAARLRNELADLDHTLASRLAAVDDRPFLVFHDGYQYFERRYGLAAAGSITVDPERRPGARRLAELHDRLDELEIACVFAEPQFEPALVETVVGGTEVRTGVLDPLGADLEAGPAQYFELLDALADSLIECLGPAKAG